MLRKFLERAQDEKGFTLIELLVVILIIGILAAIAIPSFLNQRSKGNDAEAKSSAVTAAQAVETYATDNNGSYAGATTTAIRAIEPTLSDAQGLALSNLSINTYTVTVQSKRDTAGGVTFTLARNSTGQTARSCATGTFDRGGCSATSGGTW